MSAIKTRTFVTIRYAPKPWDRGRPPMTRTIEAPYAYTEEDMKHWLWDKLLIKSGETIVSTETRDAALGHPDANSVRYQQGD